MTQPWLPEPDSTSLCAHTTIVPVYVPAGAPLGGSAVKSSWAASLGQTIWARHLVYWHPCCPGTSEY